MRDNCGLIEIRIDRGIEATEVRSNSEWCDLTATGLVPLSDWRVAVAIYAAVVVMMGLLPISTNRPGYSKRHQHRQ